jgi:antitoxin Phd
MKIDTNNIVSLTDANRNFSRVARLADDVGAVVIMRNNAPSYLLTTFAQAEQGQQTPDEDVVDAARRIVSKSRNSFEAAQGGQSLKSENRCVMRDTEQKIREVNATMAMEGMPLTDEDKSRLRDIFEGRKTVEKTVQELIQKHSPRRKTAYERV